MVSSPCSHPRRILLLLALLPVGGAEEGGLLLVQLQVVTRHGARTQLSKDAATLAEGGAVLTKEGERQLASLGSQLREVYLVSPSGSGSPRGSGKLDGLYSFHGGQIWVQSSDLDRTITSAMALNSGLWPLSSASEDHLNLTELVPVHTIPTASDVTIRAYSNCPSFRDDLARLYASQSFRKRRDNHLALLSRLAEVFPDLAASTEGDELPKHVPLEEIWNAYDALEVLDPSGSEGVVLSEEQRTELAALAAWVELQRYGRATAGAKLGCNIWEEVISRVQSLYAFNPHASSQGELRLDVGIGYGLRQPHLHPPHQYVHYSAHYPTILAMLAALDLFEHNPQTLAPEVLGIPGYSSALLIEVWRRGDEKLSEEDLLVRVRFRPGGVDAPAISYLNLGPSCSAASEAAGLPGPSCPLKTLRQAIAGDPLWPATLGEWCNTCKNTQSNQCSNNAEAKEEAVATKHLWMGVGAGVLAGLAVAAFVGALAMRFCWGGCSLPGGRRPGNPQVERGKSKGLPGGSDAHPVDPILPSSADAVEI